MPCPKGPLPASTPCVTPYSGCPGVIESTFLKLFKSLIDKLYPAKCNIVYKSIEPCPQLNTNLSLFIQFGLNGLATKKSLYKTYIAGAKERQTPGCPLLAKLIPSIQVDRIAATDNWSIFNFFGIF